MGNNKTVIIPFTLPWDWSADFQRQTCLELARRNFQVFAYMNDDAYFFTKDIKKKYPKIKNITFYVPKYFVPFRRIKIIETINKYLSLILFNLKIFSRKKIIWIFDPQFYYFPKFFTNKISLYDCVDYFGSKHEKDENRLIKNTDRLFVNSNSLMSVHKNKKDNITLVPQGFNLSEFENNIKSVKKNKKNKSPVIGYVGGVNYRIDYKLLNKLISNNPQWNFSFWGPIQNYPGEKLNQILKEVKRLQNLPNVSFNNTKNKLELMNAINNFDICMIPYDTKQEFNINCYPMKVFEYFYLGKPVISTQINELSLTKFEDLIKISNTPEDWKKNIKLLLNSPWTKNLQKKQYNLATDNSWKNKVDKILFVIK